MSCRLATVIAFALGAVVWGSQPADATTCSVPYNNGNGISTGSTASASQINSNFASLQSCGNNIDSNNIGSGGIFASQIKPTNTTQATFGGSYTYTFPTTIATSAGVNTGVFGTASGGLNYGVDTGTNTYVSLGPGDGSAASGVNAEYFGVFGEPTTGTPVFAVDHSGNTGATGVAKSVGVSSSTTITANSGAATSFYANNNDGVAGLLLNANGGANQTAIGVNTGSGYPMLSFAKLSNTGTFQSWLAGWDTSGNLINSGELRTSTNVVANSGSGSFGTTLTAGGVIKTTSGTIQESTGGTTYTLPYDANSTSGSANTHVEHSKFFISLGIGACLGNTDVFFTKSFSVGPDVIPSFELVSGTWSGTTAPVPILTAASTTTKFTVNLCNGTGNVLTGNIHWMALGE
jgi:hypothetical protein